MNKGSESELMNDTSNNKSMYTKKYTIKINQSTIFHINIQFSNEISIREAWSAASKLSSMDELSAKRKMGAIQKKNIKNDNNSNNNCHWTNIAEIIFSFHKNTI